MGKVKKYPIIEKTDKINAKVLELETGDLEKYKNAN